MFDETTETVEETESRINPVCLAAGAFVAGVAGYCTFRYIRIRRQVNREAAEAQIIDVEKVETKKETVGSKS